MFQKNRKGVARLLGTQKAIPHLLEFLRDTEVGLRHDELGQRRNWEESNDREDEEEWGGDM